ncbi:metal ABC transporter ATP-binding protein [Millisia brevis]|uniref:metal ABC transporter ATP-binding protein n=1 Tax=Millisia brevis TaxID=264148 RepID=UPI00082F2BE2|nr:ATP-binding cassette domain-containing protein [Millisia brevis]
MSAIELTDAALAYGHRTLWHDLNVAVEPGEFVAVLGPNGSGKTSLLRVLLGEKDLASGTAAIDGAPVGVGNPRVGYVPQQRPLDPQTPLRGRDLLGLAWDGHRWGIGLRGRRRRRAEVDAAIARIDAGSFADAPVGTLSGGELQRLRVAGALIGDPSVLLCDEPLLSLDPANQERVIELIDRRRRSDGTAVLFVTHEINPILPVVDRVLYLANGQFRIGPPREVITSEVLSELYHTDVEVLDVRGRLIVVGTGDNIDVLGSSGHHHHHEPSTEESTR